MKILEIGTGNNQYSHFLNNALHLDIDKTAFHIETLGDIHFLPFQDNTFDLIYVGESLKMTTPETNELINFISNNIVDIRLTLENMEFLIKQYKLRNWRNEK